MLHPEDRISDCKPPLARVLLLVIAWVEGPLLEFVDEEAIISLAAAPDGDLGAVLPDEVAMEQHLLEHGALLVGIWLGPPGDLVIVIEDVEQIFQHIQIGPNRTL